MNDTTSILALNPYEDSNIVSVQKQHIRLSGIYIFVNDTTNIVNLCLTRVSLELSRVIVWLARISVGLSWGSLL